MRTFIVATDFSPVAQNATLYAMNLAKEIGASVTLLHIYQIPITFSEVPVPLVTADELKKTAEEKLLDAKLELDKLFSHTVKIYTEAALGDVVDELQELSRKLDPLAVVMGSKGHSAVERVFLGSTTLTALRHLDWPVLVVPPGAQFKKIRKLGFACDFRDVVENTPTRFIKDWANLFQAEFHVLNVDHENRNFRTDTPEQSALLHTMIEGLQPHYHFIDNPSVEDGLHMFAETHNLDMLIIVPKKHKLFDALFQKHHTKDMIYHAHVPILAMHEQ